MLINVSILNPREILFEGKAKSIIVPGEQGVFEVLPFHKRLLSRLVSGVIFVDERSFSIRRGIIKVDLNKVIIVLEE
jgi:F0F1-type ATP synthase epsilon subunit